MNETFGQRLSRIRKEKGMTQEDIAKRIVISPQAVSKWENDISSPDILVLSSLADILGVSVDELLGREAGSTAETVEAEVVNDDEKIMDDKQEKEEKKNKGFFHIEDDGDYVHFGKDGIHIHDKNGDKVDIDGNGVRVNDEPRAFYKKKKENVATFWLTSGTLFGLAAIGYIFMGLFWTYESMGWKIGWLLFLLVICITSLAESIKRRRFCHFAYPVLVTGVYLLLGFLLGGWGFYWFLFLTIPAYYLIFGPIDDYYHKNHGCITSDSEDDD